MTGRSYYQRHDQTLSDVERAHRFAKTMRKIDEIDNLRIIRAAQANAQKNQDNQKLENVARDCTVLHFAETASDQNFTGRARSANENINAITSNFSFRKFFSGVRKAAASIVA